MISVYDYLDYRKYLSHWFDESKAHNSFVSYRYIAGKVRLDASFLVKVFQGQMHLSKKSIAVFADFLRLSGKEREYFQHLVFFGRAKDPHETQLFFDKLVSLQPHAVKILDADKYQFFNKWYTITVYELLRFYPFKGDYRSLARKVLPPISASQAKEAVEVLERLEFIQKRDDGTYLVKDAAISTGEKWLSAAIRNYQKQTIELAIGALDSIPQELRDISTMTLSLSKETFATVRERIMTLRRELHEIAKNDLQLDGVYQINFLVFPVSQAERNT